MDDRFDEWLEQAAEDYNRPPEPPREAMWQAIAAARVRQPEEPAVIPFRRRVPRWVALPVAAAALIALGIGVDRLALSGRDHPPAGGGAAPRQVAVTRPAAPAGLPASGAENPADSAAVPRESVGSAEHTGTITPVVQRHPAESRRPAASNEAYAVVAAEYLAQSEAFLTLFRSSIRNGADERLAPATAHQLLATNRLLLDSPAARDPQMRRLLEDVELVLAQIAQLAPDSARSGDVRLITDGMERNDVLLRLRTASPAGRATISQGVL